MLSYDRFLIRTLPHVYFQLETSIEDLTNTLQCPVCLETAHNPPIFQCPEGHLLCQDCNKRLKECPRCGNPLQNSRNGTAEKLAEKLRVKLRMAYIIYIYTTAMILTKFLIYLSMLNHTIILRFRYSKIVRSLGKARRLCQTKQ